MYAIRSYYDSDAFIRSINENINEETCIEIAILFDFNSFISSISFVKKSYTLNPYKNIKITARITSYNVCYTKLLRLPVRGYYFRR